MFFYQYRDYVFKTAFFITRSRSLADDITQETFIRIYSKYGSYDTIRPLKPWIYTITVNVTRTHLKKQRWVSLLPFSTNLVKEQLESLDETVMKSEELNELWNVVQNLSIKSREVIMLHFYHGFTLKETAEILSIPLGTCKSRLHTALKQLRASNAEIISYYVKGGELSEKGRFS
ncbi:sigma-70 family RNA polymerase sigma factor [Bacillus coahuilensis]|uniref:sigma-70 family RNA polymerase sigma factor n=1 Tax=Bacillus coahuilensis TaxID=408580 RepID=UPI000494C068